MFEPMLDASDQSLARQQAVPDRLLRAVTIGH